MKTFILCGGSGTRLWPLSRMLEPKQFLPLFNNQSLFQKTLLRNLPVSSKILVISNQKMAHFIHNQMPSTDLDYQILAETIGRNTAAAIALGCLCSDPDDIILVTPSDHLIQKEEHYLQALKRAEELALDGFIVTFGIHPTKPETGFGYIEADGENVLAFHEKPSLEIAQEYVQTKQHFWNSGMFCFQASTLLEELKKHASEIHQASKELVENHIHSFDEQQIVLPKEALLKIPSLSIDYAVMEHSQKIKMVSCDLGWSDLGSFDALREEFQPKEPSSNISLDSSLHTWNAENNLLLGSKREVALIGVQDLIIVDTPDALLITKKGQSQDVKNIVTKLKEEESKLLEHHRLIHRPWGSYEVLLDEPTYKVKRIVVKPNQKISLQKHLYRSEHWTIVEGVAWVTKGEETFQLQINQSTHIPQKTIHRVENKQNIDLVFIEVQQGSSTSEDDIIRFEDLYGRV